MRFNHDTGNIPITSGKLGADIVNNFGLVVVVLLRIAVWNNEMSTPMFTANNTDSRLQSIMTLAWLVGRAFSIALAAPRTCSDAKLGPLVPPRRMTCTSWFPRVFTIAARPCSVTPMKAWGFEEERIASMATET